MNTRTLPMIDASTVVLPGPNHRPIAVSVPVIDVAGRHAGDRLREPYHPDPGFLPSARVVLQHADRVRVRPTVCEAGVPDDAGRLRELELGGRQGSISDETTVEPAIEIRSHC